MNQSQAIWLALVFSYLPVLNPYADLYHANLPTILLFYVGIVTKAAEWGKLCWTILVILKESQFLFWLSENVILLLVIPSMTSR